MWTLSGPFDGEAVGDVGFTKTKLVKPGKDYVLGRKEKPLTINNKKVSREHAVFLVGGYSIEDAEDPSKRPTLKLHNVGTGNRKYERGTSELTVDKNSVVDLQDGDVVRILHDVPIGVKWEPVVCYSPIGQEGRANVRECAELGISLLLQTQAGVTHHLASTYVISPTIAMSLLTQAHIVKPEWLNALISSGLSTDVSSNLEQQFVLPPVSKFRPSFSPSLPSSLKNHRSWEPNVERANMFSEHRFIFVGQRGSEVREDYKELVRQGGATYECCPAEGGRKALHGVLAKAESKGKQPVLVADDTAIKAVIGQAGWDGLVEEAASYELRFIAVERLSQAVVHVDRTYVDCTLQSKNTPTSATPDVIRNTNPDEPSIPPSAPADVVALEGVPEPEPEPPKRKLVRRFGGRAASREPSAPPADHTQTQAGSSSTGQSAVAAESTAAGEAHTDAPKRRPVRRFAAGKIPVIGIDDPSMIDEAAEAPQEKALEQLMPPPTQTRSRLKRRFGPAAQAAASQRSSIFDNTPTVESEPSYKQYQSLFEASDPDKIAQVDMDGYRNVFKDTQTPVDDAADMGTGSRSSGLNVIREEEEGTLTQLRERQQLLKRKAGDALEVEHDVEMEDANGALRASKRRAVEDLNAVEPAAPSAKSQAPSSTVTSAPAKPPSKAAPKSSTKASSSKSITGKSQPDGGVDGADPDKDEAFLKAVASTKRGKKHEDSFDREFNNLRISKPDLQNEEAAEEWAILDDFDDDTSLRGNFMVVVEMDVYRKDENSRNALRVTGGRADWEGRVNFKKFKQKACAERRRPVELVVDDDMYPTSIDDQLFRGMKSQRNTRPTEPNDSAEAPSSTFSDSRPARKRTLALDSDDEMLPPPKKGKAAAKRSAPPSRAPSAEPQTRSARGKGKATAKENPLFLESDEEEDNTSMAPSMSVINEDEENAMNEDEDDESMTLTTTTTRRTQRRPATQTKPKKRAVAIMDDDSDNGFAGFERKKRTRR